MKSVVERAHLSTDVSQVRLPAQLNETIGLDQGSFPGEWTQQLHPPREGTEGTKSLSDFLKPFDVRPHEPGEPARSEVTVAD